jgi:hypothetical protein
MMRRNYRKKAFCPDWDCFKGRAQEDREWIADVTVEWFDWVERRAA